MIDNTKINTVEKESVSEMQFSKADVIDSVNDRKIRLAQLQKAVTLGNAYKQKVCIYFKTEDGYLKRVDTTIWAVGDEFVNFKSGLAIPIRSVFNVEF